MKNWNELKEYILDGMNEEAPLNIAGDGSVVKGLDDEPPVRKRKKFAGCEVFEVDSDEYTKCLYGRNRYERWNRKMDMEKIENAEIRNYAHKNPTSSIIVQNNKTGEMSYLIRR